MGYLERVRADGKSEYELIRRIRLRSAVDDREAYVRASAIVDEVAERGDEALRDYTEKFDGWRPVSLEAGRDELEAAKRRIDPALLSALERAAEEIRLFHEKQLAHSFFLSDEDGGLTGQRVRAVERAGVYVPGGTAAYPSSVLMNVIPARVAGVREVIMTSPRRADAAQGDAVLAAAAVAGVDRLFCVGGAQAIGALAFGTESIPAVDRITGPGNIYVAMAKRYVSGRVGIDMIAGPSEILVMAGDGARPELAAADLLSQAEHDAMACPLLICDSEEFAQAVEEQLVLQLAALPRRETAEKSLRCYGAAVVCPDREKACAIANALAPEHLEVLYDEPQRYLGSLYNAGSIFLGSWSPEPYGDYMAGPNHVLPTGGTARFSSPLSVETFLKRTGVIFASKASLESRKDDIIRLARAEGLDAHAASIAIRFAPAEGEKK